MESAEQDEAEKEGTQESEETDVTETNVELDKPTISVGDDEESKQEGFVEEKQETESEEIQEPGAELEAADVDRNVTETSENLDDATVSVVEDESSVGASVIETEVTNKNEQPLSGEDTVSKDESGNAPKEDEKNLESDIQSPNEETAESVVGVTEEQQEGKAENNLQDNKSDSESDESSNPFSKDNDEDEQTHLEEAKEATKQAAQIKN
eukprot:gi/632971612/ref/XP_007902256.1/ PREDICTED: protein transport protein SEC7-like [Callorhinchus milii]